VLVLAALGLASVKRVSRVGGDGVLRSITTQEGPKSAFVRIRRGVPDSSTNTASGDSLFFAIRAEPVPRIMVRFQSGQIDLESGEADVKKGVRFAVAFPRLIEYQETSGVEGFQAGSDTIVRNYNLRPASYFLQKNQSVSGDIKTVTFTASRSDQLVEFVYRFTDDLTTITNEAGSATIFPDEAKVDIKIRPNAVNNVSAGNSIAILARISYSTASSDNSQGNTNKLKENAESAVPDDVTFASEDGFGAGFLNWERTVLVTYKNGSTQEKSVVAQLVMSNQMAGTVDQDAGNDDNVISFLSKTAWVAFSIPGNAADVASIFWDPAAGADSAACTASRALALVLAMVSTMLLTVL